MRLLLIGHVEDCGAFVDTFLQAGHTCVQVPGTGIASALRTQQAFERPEAVLLCEEERADGRRPGLRAIREFDPHIPVIVLSSKGDMRSRVATLRAGADEHLVRPQVEELLARLEVLERRLPRPNLYVHGDLEIDAQAFTVTRRGTRVPLSSHAQGVLRVLLEANGEVVSKSRLLREVWDLDFDPGTTVVEVQIARLRRRLGPEGATLIRNEIGRGYRIEFSGSPGRG